MILNQMNEQRWRSSCWTAKLKLPEKDFETDGMTKINAKQLKHSKLILFDSQKTGHSFTKGNVSR